MEKNIRVELGSRSYNVRIGSGVLTELGAFVLQCSARAKRVVVITDSTVADKHGPAAVASLQAAGLTTNIIQFPAGESNKTLATYTQLMDQLLSLAPAIDRSCMIVALGGGVPGDVAGFVAATALRGLNWVQCPTTLLADVDASVGGKTAVDHPSGKNLVGAFHQPRGVLIDVETLKTLPPGQLGNGLAECVKHAVIRDESLLDFIEGNAREILACRTDRMVELVSRNVAIKAAVVSADEREAGERAHLNLGHTIGHAIETLVGYDRIGHGAAVALGMLAAFHMAQSRGLVNEKDSRRIETLLGTLGLPTRLAQLHEPMLSIESIWQVMQHDKKSLAGKVRMVLPRGLGNASVFDDITQKQIADAVESIR